MKTLQQYLKDFAEQSDNVLFRNDYSGRGMFGDRCVGITGGLRECHLVLGYIIAELMDDLANEGTAAASSNVETYKSYALSLMQFSQDNMGYDVILYWPRLQPIEGDNDDIDINLK